MLLFAATKLTHALLNIGVSQAEKYPGWGRVRGDFLRMLSEQFELPNHRISGSQSRKMSTYSDAFIIGVLVGWVYCRVTPAG